MTTDKIREKLIAVAVSEIDHAHRTLGYPLGTVTGHVRTAVEAAYAAGLEVAAAAADDYWPDKCKCGTECDVASRIRALASGGE